MKATGIVRKVDGLGRLVIPNEIRDRLNIYEGCPMEIFTDNNEGIVLKKYEPACIFTDIGEDLIEYRGRKVSKEAIKEMAGIIGLI